MGQTNQSNNFIIYNISLHYDRQFQFNPLNAELNPICHVLALLEPHHILHFSRIKVNESGIQKITQTEKNINEKTFYFVEEGPGRGSEDIK